MRVRFVLVVAAAAVLGGGAAGQQSATDWHVIEQTLGRSGTPQAGGVMTFRFPRTDLSVMVGDVKVKPALALGSWLSFLPAANGAIAMGDFVLTQDEVAPVMRALEGGGVEVAAVHNHLIGEQPRIIYMHIMTRGDAARIAATVRAALALTGTPLTPAPAAVAALFPLDTLALARALGAAGKVNGGVYQLSVPRMDTISSGGTVLPPGMGLAIVINLQPLDSSHVAVAGDFVLTPDEVTPVVRVLIASGMDVTAVHSHVMSSTPALLFVHFWGVDSATRLTGGLRRALAIALHQPMDQRR